MFQDIKRKILDKNLAQILKHILQRTHYDIFLELDCLILLNTQGVFTVKHSAFSDAMSKPF